MEEKLNMKIDSIENYGREGVGNTERYTERAELWNREQMRLRGGMWQVWKNKLGNGTNREERRKSVRQRNCKRVGGG